MKKIFISCTLFAVIAFAAKAQHVMYQPLSNIDTSNWDLEYCSTKTIFVNRTPIPACYKVKPKDTLWAISKKYFGTGFDWEKLKVFSETRSGNIKIEEPEKLQIGTRILVFEGWEIGGSDNGHGWGLDSKSGDLYTIKSHTIYKNDEVYDDGFSWVLFFTLDKRTNNKVYIVNTKSRDNATCFSTSKILDPGTPIPEAGYQVVMNKEINDYYSCGQDFKLLTFSPNGKYYAIRNNTNQDSQKMRFIVLSNMKNGPEYDFIDSLIWYNNDTLVYRAQNNDQWRVVVNHEDYAVYDYLENLRLENGVIKFSARHDDGTWSEEKISL